ncbi:Pyrrolidone-carboxylate peptidase [Linum perenne]
MGSEGPKAVVIHVTGFKKFQGVSQNPTETIVNKLKDYVEKRGLPAGVTLGSCTILETAGDGARKMLYQTLESSTATNGDKNEQVVWVHMGVNSGAVKFAIERQAVNEATFRCPDELGWQPNTGCSVDEMLRFLKKKGFDVMISDDAGRFVCNYVYYHSLRFAKQKGHKSLFVHVPLFSRIDEETQMQFVASVLEAIGSTC